MRAIKRKWCLSYFKLSTLCISIYLFHFSNALTNADLGLPRINHCAFSYNESLYIFGGNSIPSSSSSSINNIMMTFDYPNWNTTVPTVSSLSNSTGKSNVKCGRATEKAIVFDDTIFHVLDLSTNQPLNMSYQGSQSAIDSFITNKGTIQNAAVVGFNDYFLIYGGEQGNQTLQSTFILDTRVNNLGVWYELAYSNSSMIGSPPPPSSNTTLVATSRWILHFRSVKINPVTYTIFVDLFDPFNFNWLGTPITAFNTSTDAINAVPLDPDTLLIIPAYRASYNTSNYNSNNGDNQADTVTGFWMLNVSTWTPTARVQWQEMTNGSRSYHPVLGGSVSAIRDVAVFYGGNHEDEEFLFFNTTSNSFQEHPSWYTASESNHRNLLGILLGSILGGIAFLILLFIIVWCCCIKKRRKSKQNEFQSRSYEESYAKERMIPNEGPSDFRRSNSVASRYLLSPIKSVLPLFKDNDDDDDDDDEKNERQVKEKGQGGEEHQEESSNHNINNNKPTIKQQPTSRFREHFDMTSFPHLKKSNALDQGQSSSSN